MSFIVFSALYFAAGIAATCRLYFITDKIYYFTFDCPLLLLMLFSLCAMSC